MNSRGASSQGPSSLQPPEPLVERNRFRKRLYVQEPFPSFEDVKACLPEPILPERPDWVEMYWRAWELSISNLGRPDPGSSLVSAFSALPGDGFIDLWNSCCISLFGLYARQRVSLIASLDNFYANQHGDGFMCRAIGRRGTDRFFPFDPDATGPNVFAWTEWCYFRSTGDDSRLEQVFWPIMAFHRWCKANRTWPDGSYWATGWSSGMNNQARVPDSAHHHRHWSWIDATAQAALDCSILRKMALHLGADDKVKELVEEHSKLGKLINESMWNEGTGFYHDISPEGSFSPVKSIGAFWLLLDPEIIPEERLQAFAGQLRENRAFNLPHRVPSQSADSDGYDAESGNRWRGGVWSPTNYMVLKGLRNKTLDGLAHEIAVNHLQNVGQVFQQTNTFWEYYAPEEAAPGRGAKKDYVGWTGLTPVAMLLEDVIGLNVDWPQRRVVWDRRLNSSGPWGVRNYPLGSQGHLDLVGDVDRVVVQTDVPFALQVQQQGESIMLAVSRGTTEIDLSSDI